MECFRCGGTEGLSIKKRYNSVMKQAEVMTYECQPCRIVDYHANKDRRPAYVPSYWPFESLQDKQAWYERSRAAVERITRRFTNV